MYSLLLAGIVLLASASCVNSNAPEFDPLAPEPVAVNVELDSQLAVVQPNAFGIHTSVYDNALNQPEVPELLRSAGITMLRYPGGGYSDNYHWSTHDMTAWCNGDDGYLARGTDLGNYVRLLDQFRGIITVNYGSNLAGDGPGEPKEAAAWVAYANGDPANTTVIGPDSAGNDWRSVGFWATVRASTPLATDDGYNFLRVGHPAPLDIEYWEIGNEVFGNGYYGEGNSLYELDLHLPCSAPERAGHANLSPATYGANVREFVREMKAVDPTIKVGAVLNTPPLDYRWGPTWNDDVLSQSADVIDFGIVHWYAEADVSALATVAGRSIPEMISELRADFATHAGARAAELEILVTELGTRARVSQESSQLTGLFAANSYATFLAHGVSHIDWLELHQVEDREEDLIFPPSFLSERDAAFRGPAYHGIQMVHHLAKPGDALVRVSSDTSSLVAHAARGAHGSARVMLSNGSRILTRLVTLTGLQGSSARRYDYFPLEQAHGTVTEGQALAAVDGAFTVEVPPYGISVVVVGSEP